MICGRTGNDAAPCDDAVRVKTPVEYQEAELKAARKEADVVFGAARRIPLGTGAVAAVPAIGIAIWVTLSITRPIAKAVDVADSSADGDLTARALRWRPRPRR